VPTAPFPAPLANLVRDLCKDSLRFGDPGDLLPVGHHLLHAEAITMNKPGRNGLQLRHTDFVRAAAELMSSAAQSVLAASWRHSLVYHHLDPETRSQPDRVEAAAVRECARAPRHRSPHHRPRSERTVVTRGACARKLGLVVLAIDEIVAGIPPATPSVAKI
jgi:hypothetical protein